jgi:hypothetical protein
MIYIVLETQSKAIRACFAERDEAELFRQYLAEIEPLDYGYYISWQMLHSAESAIVFERNQTC